jgi:hypothetical protein
MASYLSSTMHHHHHARITSGAAASSSSSSLLTRPRLRPINAVTVRLDDGSGRAVEVTDAEWTFGSDGSKANCAIGDEAGGVAGVHARLTQKQRGTKSTATQVFLTALVDLDEGVLGNSRTWLDGQPLRPGVQYVIGSGQRVELGRARDAGGAASFTVEFAEGTGRDPLVEMMMAGMAGSQGGKLKDALAGKD